MEAQPFRIVWKLTQLPVPASGKHRPMGSVGLALDNEAEIAALLRDMVRAFEVFGDAFNLLKGKS